MTELLGYFGACFLLVWGIYCAVTKSKISELSMKQQKRYKKMRFIKSALIAAVVGLVIRSISRGANQEPLDLVDILVFFVIVTLVIGLVLMIQYFLDDKNRNTFTDETVKHENSIDKANDDNKSFVKRLSSIRSNITKYEYFRISEIVSGLINLMDAKENLSHSEYNEIALVYDALTTDHTQIKLNLEAYYLLIIRLISNFDLIAPFFKFCGNEEINEDFLIDEGNKSLFRHQASNLIEGKNEQEVKDLLRSQQWKSLQSRYIVQFFKDISTDEDVKEAVLYATAPYVQAANKNMMKKIYDDLLGDDDYHINEAKEKRFTKMFRQPFSNVIHEESTTVYGYDAVLYTFNPNDLMIGSFIYMIEVFTDKPRYFASEYSYDNKYVLCEWTFEEDKKQSHLNYGPIVDSPKDIINHHSRLLSKVASILEDSEQGK